MDPSQYHQNGLSNNNSQYASLPGVSPHQLQQGASHAQPHTLPPLQGPSHGMQMYGGSAPHTPRTPATPNTPGSANNMSNFPQQLGGQSRNYSMMPGTNYPPQNQGYQTSRPMMTQAPTAMSHPQPIAPAPTPASRMQQPLRPMPTNGLQHMGAGMQPYGQNSMLSQMQDMEPPTHVVGSQGRRGILPSAPGRPQVSQTGTGTGKNALIPAKDADGKFPCPHCTKTYLHAKHLKRHLLRHTGDRPYMCVLCRDTFSRSDILKRHFQKCSIRRGNPTGASHLSHAQAHLKKSHPGPHKSSNSMSNENDLMGVNVMPNVNVFGVVPNGDMPDAASSMTDQQVQERSNSMKCLSAGDGRDGRGMAGLGQGSAHRNGFDQNYGGIGGNSMPGTGMNPSLAFNIPHGQNGHSYGQGQGYDYDSHGNSSSALSHAASGQDWSQMFQTNDPDGFISAYTPSIASSHVSIKTEPTIHDSTHRLFSGIYTGISTSTSMPSWNLQNDPLGEVSSRLIYFCFPNEQSSSRSNGIRAYLSAANIKHFLEQFTSFQGHFPILHIPTFRIAQAFEGLLLGMICIGAVYSDRLHATQVRDMMEFSKAVIERNSQIYAIISREQTRDSGFGDETIVTSGFGASESDLEQITAIFMMQLLFTWHGTPIQREKARREFPLAVEIARRAGLTKPMTTLPFSVLHQPNVRVDNFNAASFDWNAWVEQEKRSRLMFTLFLTDCALTLYFNNTPQFEKDEIRLPLPADDAAWNAQTSAECAEALGLHGTLPARSRSPEGSRRLKQPEMHSALNALMHNVWDLQPGTTNLYSKFILIHALHIQLWTAQRQTSLQESGQLNPQNLSFPSSGTNTPISQHDWVRGVEPTGSGPHSANTSGRATPVEASNQSALVQCVNSAFDKWKKAWDIDMAAHYPPSSSHYHRFGFYRDAVHFYWLAKYLMKNNRSMDWQIAPDQRFAQFINLLKSIKTWVVSDSAKRGEELDSVSDIGKDYGVTDLTLDMAQLFRPINKQIDSPAPGVHTNIGMA